jgi:hypothetical protein
MLAAGAQFMDLAGDGQPDLVVLEGSTPGLYEHDDAESWQPVPDEPLSPQTHGLPTGAHGGGNVPVLVAFSSQVVWEKGFAQ